VEPHPRLFARLARVQELLRRESGETVLRAREALRGVGAHQRRRRGQPSKKEKHALKVAVYERAGGLCELKLHKECSGARVLPFEGDVFERAHMVHLKSKGSGGAWTMENLRNGCPACHLGSMHTEGKKLEC
jgi:5-methylcytosine-specific restriction endonuclease McrA